MKSARYLCVALLLGAIATSLVGCNSGGTSATSPIDLSPPQAPTHLRSTSDPSINRDWLEWDASASANVASYEVYRSSTSGGAGSLVASVGASTTDIILPIVNSDGTEYYRVRAVGTNSVPSAFTSTLGVDRTGWTGPLAPKNPGQGKGDF